MHVSRGCLKTPVREKGRPRRVRKHIEKGSVCPGSSKDRIGTRLRCCRSRWTISLPRTTQWVVDAFVNELDLAELGFEGVQAAKTGRPSWGRMRGLLKFSQHSCHYPCLEWNTPLHYAKALGIVEFLLANDARTDLRFWHTASKVQLTGDLQGIVWRASQVSASLVPPVTSTTQRQT
jgi:hypothetical protein